jgi:MFS transporter, ACS family, tartrate transporter
MSADAASLGQRTVRRVAWRLIPFMALLYFAAFLDRVNIGFAALTMNEDLGLTATMFGLASGIFFVSYVIFEVPSNIIMERVGARLWIARIMVTWGLVSAATAFVSGPMSLYSLRLLLGIAEAGFFPGMILYLTYWFPAQYRGRIISTFMIALPVSYAIGGPLSTSILPIEAAGLHGWQWMFLLEGIPAALLGVLVLVFLRDGPKKAAWLTAEERDWLTGELERERALLAGSHRETLAYALREPRVWFLGLIYCGMLIGTYGFTFWLPQIVRGFGNLTTAEVGITAAIPYAVAAVVMPLLGRHSDARRERIWHIALALLVGAAGLACSAHLANSPALGLVALCAAACGMYAAVPIFWTLPTAMLTGSAAAAGIALVNSIGNTGGFLGPTLVGYVRDLTGNYTAALWTLAGMLVLTAGAVATMSPAKAHPSDLRTAQLDDERA